VLVLKAVCLNYLLSKQWKKLWHAGSVENSFRRTDTTLKLKALIKYLRLQEISDRGGNRFISREASRDGQNKNNATSYWNFKSCCGGSRDNVRKKSALILFWKNKHTRSLFSERSKQCADGKSSFKMFHDILKIWYHVYSRFDSYVQDFIYNFADWEIMSILCYL